MRRMLPALTLATVAAGCGGGDSATPQPTASPPPVTITAPPGTAQADAAPTGDPTFTITLTGESTTPVAGRAWRYTVRAESSEGGPASGTAKMRVFVDGDLVDTIGFFAFDGTLQRTHVWPRSLRGEDGVVLQAEVEGEGGTQRANLPVTVG